MILYDLRCDKGHVFEAWFHSSATFDQQVGAGEVVCAVCGSDKVEKAPMAPHVSKSHGAAEPERAPNDQTGKTATLAAGEATAELRRKLKELRQHIEANCDYVGTQFAEEARKIHYGETEARGIYGETSDEEAKKLNEEGVPISRVPWLRKDDA